LAVEEKRNAEAVTGFLVESFTPPDPNQGWAKNATVSDLLLNASKNARQSATTYASKFRLLEAVLNAQATSGYTDGQRELVALMERIATQRPHLKRDALSARIKVLMAGQSTGADANQLADIVTQLTPEGPSEDLVNAQFALVQLLMVSSKSDEFDAEIIKLADWSEKVNLSAFMNANIDVTLAKYWSVVKRDHRKAETILRAALTKPKYSSPVLKALFLQSLSVIMSRLKEFEAGYSVARESADIYARTYEESNSAVINAQVNLAAAALETGRLSEAEKIYNNVRKITKQLGADGRPEYVMTSFNMVEVYTLQGRPDDALALMEQVVTDASQIFMITDSRRRLFEMKLVELYLKTGRCQLASTAISSLKITASELNEIEAEVRKRCLKK
jgi:tetratricopeptide (TPR) repeat protein